MKKDLHLLKNMLTQEGFDKLALELEDRKINRRTDIANKLQLASEQGDLSENAAYKTALEEKELNENRIAELEEILADSEIMKGSDTVGIGMGNKVTLKKTATGQKYKYTLVGQSEANPALGNISVDSPVGKSIYGHHKGDKVSVKLSAGVVEYLIVELE